MIYHQVPTHNYDRISLDLFLFDETRSRPFFRIQFLKFLQQGIFGFNGAVFRVSAFNF